MAFCANCGTEISDQALACPKCGHPTATGPGTNTGSVAEAKSGHTLAILGFVFGGVAVLLLPILFGPAGIVCAAISTKRGDSLGKRALGVAIGGTVLGLVLGILVFTSRRV